MSVVKSDCCNAATTTGKSGTHYFSCSQCGKGCTVPAAINGKMKPTKVENKK